MKLTLALVLGLTGRAMAGDMSQFTASGGSISESSITVTSFGPNRIVTTGAGGVLVTYSTFSLTGAGNVGIGTATPQWPLTTAAPVSGVTSEGVATVTNPTLGMFWNQGGNASLVVRGSSETAGAAASASVILESNSGVQSTNFLMRTSSGTQSARALINSADRLLGTVGWNTWTSGTTYSQVGSIKTFTEGVPASASNIPTYVTFNTASTATISATEKMRLESNGGLRLYVRTKAQIDALTTIEAGEQILCSDCTVPYDLCVATAAATLSAYRATINSAINTAIPGTLVSRGCGSGN